MASLDALWQWLLALLFPVKPVQVDPVETESARFARIGMELRTNPGAVSDRDMQWFFDREAS